MGKPERPHVFWGARCRAWADYGHRCVLDKLRLLPDATGPLGLNIVRYFSPSSFMLRFVLFSSIAVFGSQAPAP